MVLHLIDGVVFLMLVHPGFDPIALQIGPLAIRWYGLMYLLSFIGFYWLVRYRIRQHSDAPINAEQVSDLLFYIALGIVLGGRLGYVLFYDFSAVVQDPLRALQIWKGGMSFHGGLIGVIVAEILYARKLKVSPFIIADFLAFTAPAGLFFGRIGNFINGELWGRTTDMPWGMVFNGAGPLPRHPSMLYEALLEGFVLFVILWFYSARPRPLMAVSGCFLLFYGLFRFMVEFVREPDGHIGFIALDWLTMGMMLSLPMIAIGAGLMMYAYKRHSVQ